MRESNKLIYRSGSIDDTLINMHIKHMALGPLTSLLMALTVVFGIVCLVLVFGIDLDSDNVKYEFTRLLIVSLIWTISALSYFNRMHKLLSAAQTNNSCIVISRFNEDGINTKGLVRVSIAGVRGKLWCTSNGIINAYRGVPVVMLITNMTNDDISKLINSRKGIPKKNVISVYIGAKYKGNQRDIGFIL